MLLIAVQVSSNGGICIAQGDIKTRIGGSWNASGDFFASSVAFVKGGQGFMDDDEGFSYSWTADNHLLMLGDTFEVSGCGDELILKSNRGGKVVLKRPKT